MTTSSGQKRALLLAATTGYQTRMFAEAAEHMGVELVYATDRCDQIEDPWHDNAIPIRFHEEWRSVDTILKVAEREPFDAILAVGDRPTVIAAYLARLLGLPNHPPEAAAAARDKRLTRAKLKSAGLPVPAFITVPVATDISTIVHRVTFPAVIKPTVLSASRGVIRVDDAVSLATAFDRVRRLLTSPEIRELHDAEADVIQIEDFIPGEEYAVEAMLEHGRCRVLAIFDKPDPLDGPFFEETIYVTPSRAPLDVQQQIETAVATRRDRDRAVSRAHPRRVPRQRQRRVHPGDCGAADRRLVREGAPLRTQRAVRSASNSFCSATPCASRLPRGSASHARRR